MLFHIQEPCGEFTEVTGTVKMFKGDDDTEEAEDAQCISKLKQSKKGFILTPQPSDDPNDPLNWPLWHRDVILAVIGLLSFLCGGLVGLVAPAMGTIEASLNEKPMLITIGVNGMCMIGLGVGNFILGAVARVWAKRPVYLVAVPFLFAGFAWCANAKQYYELVVSRLLQGFGGSIAECLVSATISEIYFAHERGFRLAMYTLLFIGGKNLWPTIAGFIATGLHDWHWVFWVAAILAGTLWFLIFFFVHESSFRRDPPCFETDDSKPASSISEDEKPTAGVTLERTHTKTVSPGSDPEEVEIPTVTRRPFYKGFKLVSGRKTTEPFLRILARSLVLYTYVPVLFASFLYATSVLWLSIIAETISAMFSGPPYHFSLQIVGLLYVALFVGGVLGSAGGGKVNEYIVKSMCKRHNGWFEPEFRLLMVPLSMVTMTMGLMGFGWSAYVQDKWIAPTIFLGVIGFGTSLSCTVAIQYALDSYRELSTECLISLNVMKNLLGFVFSCFVPQFLHATGDRTPFLVFGGISIGVSAFAAPMFIYGKRCRLFAEQHDWVRIHDAVDSRL